MNIETYYSRFGWDKNPFTLIISPDLMVGYSQQTEAILSHIINHHKMAMVIGPTGSGKTTLLNWVHGNINQSNNYSCFYIPKPPVVKEELVALFKEKVGYNLLDYIKIGHLTTFNIQKYLLRKTRHKKTIFLIDEAHESSLEVLEWLRTISDIIPNLLLVFAGLPSFEKKIETELPTLFMRINTKVYLKSLTNTETEALIRKRIEKVGGNGLQPFTSDAVEKIYEITGGFPREIIKVCDQLVTEAVKNNLPTINSSFTERLLRVELPVSEGVELRVGMTLKQREILELLNKNPNISPMEIVEFIGTENYKTKQHAARSINNILRRLMADELIKRKKIGTSFVYSLTGKAQTVFAEA